MARFWFWIVVFLCLSASISSALGQSEPANRQQIYPAAIPSIPEGFSNTELARLRPQELGTLPNSEIVQSANSQVGAVQDGVFQSFQESNPGAGIGSDFFGLDDDFNQGLLIRSDNVAMRIGGYVKVDFIHDFNPIDSTDLFNVNQIEIGAAPRSNTRIHARQTRLNFDTRWNSDCGPVRLFVEGDFFFTQRESFELGTNRFRLRHAYVQYGQWTVGQTWTTFSDVAASPATLDFEGQVASISTRRTQLRWTEDIGETDWSFAVAIENPFTIIEAPPAITGEPRTETPDVVTRLRWARPKYQLQVAGLTRQLGFQPLGTAVISDTAWGVNFTQVLLLGPGTKFYSEILYGSGIGSFKGAPDVIATGPTTAEIVRSLGWMVGGTHQWNQQLSSNVTYAENRAANNTLVVPPDTLDNTTYFAVNLIYSPTDRFEYGIEYLYGQRENFDGQSGNANRIQAAISVYVK